MTKFRVVVVLASCALAAPAAAHAGGRDVACGATITSDTKLRADLTNCPADGLVIGRDGITLDLGRRTIDGTGAEGSTGIRLNGRRNVKVKNGTVQEFGVGIALDASDGNRVEDVTVRNSAGRGINALNGSDRNVFSDLRSTGNLTGIAITASTGNVVRSSALTRSEFTGVLLFGATHTRVEGNRVAGNIANGIAVVEGSSDNAVLANAVEGSDTGLIVDSSRRNLLSLNTVTGAGDGVLVAAGANTVTGNLVERSVGGCEGCSGFGIGILSGANLVTLNAVHRNATDGINVAAPGTTVALNLATRNGDLGIEAVKGVRDGGGNRASRNGNSAQCLGVRCAR
ncbi:MAG TPA: right-handed parallel beta-helix repeat-containing protein [Solirubrobacter sp.]|nr:right-handed parallel beta-helix repeat-containing protein [Solirubrobacter sp.]